MQSRNNEKSDRQDAELLLREMAEDPRIRQMKNYTQHGTVSTYDHCLAVAQMSLKMADRLHIRVDRKNLVRGALLHDYYLYDWHDHGDSLHGYHHPEIAEKLAADEFSLSEKERGIIRSHMWPLTLFHAPCSKEAALVCLADKICSSKETLQGFFKRRHS